MEALLDADSHALSEAVRRFIADESSTSFDALSRRVFEHQYARNEAYRRFCGKRGVSPDVVSSWRDVPAVPADAFKTTTLACAPAARVFRTSGTTRGEGERGTHAVVDDTIYDASVRAAFRRFVLPDRERMRTLSVVPGVTEAPDSSLSAMADILLRAFGDDESGTYVGERRILVGALFAAMDRARHDGKPLLLFGTTLAFADVLEEAARADRRFELPAGSRLVDTGVRRARDACWTSPCSSRRTGIASAFPPPRA